MPVTGSKPGPEKGPGGGGRSTFRPPWVKDGASDEVVKPAWVKRTVGDGAAKKEGNSSKENGQNPAPVKEAKLQSREIKVPVMTQKPKPVQPSLKIVGKKTEAEIEKDIEKEIEYQIEKEREKRFKLETPKLRHVEVNKDKTFNKSVDAEFTEPKLRPVLKKTAKVEESAKPPEQEPEFKDKVLKKVPEVEKSKSKVNNAPAPPPMPTLTPPKAPPPPPPPTLAPPEGFEKKPLSDSQKQTIEKLKTRARRRPDWSEMMKEVEDGKKLKHVECNDRSKPIITKKSITKVGDQFIFETEKGTAHNQLLKQIQFGVKLRPTKCNDRSKPILEGLRKFRRQMTIEEQIQKSESRRSLLEAPPPEEESGDEMDDIDKLRDDLQSTKQLLALELRNKEAQERENKSLLSKIANLEAELEREKEKSRSGAGEKGTTKSSDEVLVTSLKKDADEARKTCKELEKKYQESAEQLDTAKGTIEEQKYQIQTLEKKLAQALQGDNRSFRPQYSFCYSHEDPNDLDTYLCQGIVPSASIRRISEVGQKEDSPEIEIEMSESESDEDEEKKAARKSRRLAREVKMLRCKLNRYKDKEASAKKERAALREIMKKNQAILKTENKKFKKLEKEVKKMAKMMGEDDEDEDDEEEAEEEQEEETESEESESEETEESSTESESESEDEDASDEDKKDNLEPRIKWHENRLATLKKGNYLLQANVDRLQDEINKIREKSVSLQAELDSVLSELG